MYAATHSAVFPGHLPPTEGLLVQVLALGRLVHWTVAPVLVLVQVQVQEGLVGPRAVQGFAGRLQLFAKRHHRRWRFLLALLVGPSCDVWFVHSIRSVSSV
jgi:hypothetical protein